MQRSSGTRTSFKFIKEHILCGKGASGPPLDVNTVACLAPASGLLPAHPDVLLRASRSARQCPDCEVLYWTCTWDCYQEWGYQPICADLISYKTGSAVEADVFPNQCMAGCYVKAYEEFYAIKGFEPKIEQVVDASCDAAWKRQQALDYEYFSSPDSFKYAGLLPAEEDLPQWLRDEVADVKGNPSPSDDLELPLKIQECSICRAGGRDISGNVVLLQADGALAPSGAVEPSVPTAESPEEAVEVPSEPPAESPEEAVEVPSEPPAVSPGVPAVAPGPEQLTPAEVPSTEVVVPGAMPSDASTSVIALPSILLSTLALSLIHAMG